MVPGLFDEVDDPGHRLDGHHEGVDHSFSSKPADGYRDYHHKMTTYADMLSSPAAALDPTATAKSFRVIQAEDPESVFEYIDTASSRAGIYAVSQKLELEKVAIVGLPPLEITPSGRLVAVLIACVAP